MRFDFDLITIPDDQLPHISQLPEDLQIMARIVGVADTIKIAMAFAGTYVRCGGIKALLLQHRDYLIRKECDEGGATILSQARKWGLDPRTISKINAKCDKPDARQLSLFEKNNRETTP